MKWIGQNIYDQISKFRNTVDFSEDVTFYQPVNNADPKISIGSSDDERLLIQVQYEGTTTQTAQIVSFATFTESATANDGRFHFSVDGTQILRIQDGGLDLRNSSGISIDGTNILTDSSGTATLSNIDALDATTISTLNSALTAGDITGVTAGTGLSGGGTSGAVTLNVDASQTQITSVGSITSGVWRGTAINSTYLDADTAHLSGTQTFTGTKTLNSFKGTGGATVTNILDEDAMGSDSATALATQQSIKAYVDAVPVKAYFEFKGYGTSDGTNYEMPELITDNKAPFEHDTSAGSDGLTAQTTNTIIRSGGVVMPYTGVLKKFTGWISSTGSGTVDVGLFKFTPADNNADDLTPVLLVNEQITAAGGTKMRSFSETSSFDAGFTAGDIIYSAVLGGTSSKTWYLNSMLEVEWS